MSESKPKTKYRLYAMPLSAKNIEIAASHRFSRATPTPQPGYVLIYTDRRKPKGAEEITENRIELLSATDERWLFDSNAALIAEQIRENEPRILEGLSDSINALETELKKRKAELDRKEA